MFDKKLFCVNTLFSAALVSTLDKHLLNVGKTVCKHLQNIGPTFGTNVRQTFAQISATVFHINAGKILHKHLLNIVHTVFHINIVGAP